MTLIIAPIVVEASEPFSEAVEAALHRARVAIEAGADLIEWRIDAWPEADEATLSHLHGLLDDTPGPAVVTCRPVREGGVCEASEPDRITWLREAAASARGCRYVDVEADVDEASVEAILAAAATPGRSPGVDPPRLIRSSHDFTGRPADLTKRVVAMASDPAAAIVKIVWTARSIRDNLEAFELLASRSGPMIALCMGPFGLMSRVLAPKFGGFATYAPLDETDESAPGQVDVRTLLRQYRFRAIDEQTRVYGVIGWPVAHSAGPKIHNAAFQELGWNGVYLPLPVPDAWEHFKASVGGLVDDPRLDFRGGSVTLPHKSHLVRWVRERGGAVDPLAERIGAANTLVVDDDGAVSCANTDVAAALDAIRHGAYDEPLAGRRVAVLGAGGVARAVVAGCLDAGMAVTVFNRTATRAAALIDDLARPGDELVLGDADAAGQTFDVIVNATSLGMAGGPGADLSPLTETGLEAGVTDATIVFDTVYTPRVTPMLTDAAARGARIVTGDRMFLAQAARQCAMWTREAPPESVFRPAAPA